MPRPQHHTPPVCISDLRIHHEMDLFPVLIPTRTEHPLSRQFLRTDALRIRTAGQVRQGDLVISAFQPPAAGQTLPRADYFADGAYPADPKPYDPSCGCGVCGTDLLPGNSVVITDGWPWDVCDVHPVEAPLLVLPYYGQNPTWHEAVNLARGGTVRLDTGYESFQQYLRTGSYRLISEPPAS